MGAMFVHPFFAALKCVFAYEPVNKKNGIGNEVFTSLFIFGRSSKCFTRQASRTHDDSKRMRGTLPFSPR